MFRLFIYVKEFTLIEKLISKTMLKTMKGLYNLFNTTTLMLLFVHSQYY